MRKVSQAEKSKSIFGDMVKKMPKQGITEKLIVGKTELSKVKIPIVVTSSDIDSEGRVM